MMYRLLADLVLLLHLAFVVFALLGGVLLLRFPRLLPLHLAALGWGVAIELADGICPLTPLENSLRMRGGEAGYAGGFIEHLVESVLYPPVLPVELRYVLGLSLLLVNIVIYGFVYRRRCRHA